MSAENVVRTATGKARPVCEFCDKRGRAVETEDDGRVHIWQLAAGWSCAPFPADFQHDDGSHGDMYACAGCTVRLGAGQALYPHESRRTAHLARVDTPATAQRGQR